MFRFFSHPIFLYVFFSPSPSIILVTQARGRMLGLSPSPAIAVRVAEARVGESCGIVTHLFSLHYLTPLDPQSRFGTPTLAFQVVAKTGLSPEIIQLIFSSESAICAVMELNVTRRRQRCV